MQQDVRLSPMSEQGSGCLCPENSRAPRGCRGPPCPQPSLFKTQQPPSAQGAKPSPPNRMRLDPMPGVATRARRNLTLGTLPKGASPPSWGPHPHHSDLTSIMVTSPPAPSLLRELWKRPLEAQSSLGTATSRCRRVGTCSQFSCCFDHFFSPLLKINPRFPLPNLLS